MNRRLIQKDIETIKTMIEKTRREAAESGVFFIAIGFLGMTMAPVIGLLEHFHAKRFVLPALILMTAAAGVIGYAAIAAQSKKERVQSYPKTIYYRVLFACSIPALMAGFLFPLIGAYPWNLIPVLLSLFMGIMVFAAGTVFEIPSIGWCGAAWWVGAFFMALFEGHAWIRIAIMNLSTFMGFVVPGFILNKKYRKGRP